jgi:uncharacterized protein
MRYLIDGYTLLHATGDLVGRTGRPHGLEKARLALLGRLIALHGDDVGCVTIVFDARNAPPGAESQHDYKGVHVLYALREEADDLIETLIRQESSPRQLTIVSDDHRLKDAARRGKCSCVGCLDYLEQIGRPTSLPPIVDGTVKPQALSAEETQRWLAEFADLADDPKLKGWVELESPEDEDN